MAYGKCQFSGKAIKGGLAMNRKILYGILFGIAVLLFFPNQSDASCVCRCIDGNNIPICSSSIDLRPICPPKVCPIKPPSVQPIFPPRVPPIGTRNCIPKQVYNPYTNRYEWKEVCY